MNTLKRFDEKNFSAYFRGNKIVCFLLIIIIFFFDRITKIKIINHQIDNGGIYVNDFINLELVWNTGIGFGLLSSNSVLVYNSITTLIGLILIIITFMIIKSNYFEKILYSIILGGALGNFYDRIVYFAVPDFIDIHYQRFHWFTFNIADIFITIGILLLIIKELFLANGKD
tara:strand:+ start:1537 stop:2052 length:516 start_codon:yes stop_codon:yes gene_type:complete